MEDQDIHQLLQKLVQYGIRPGGLIVLVAAVTKAGANVEAVEDYVIGRGGQRVVEAGQQCWLVPKSAMRRHASFAW